MEPLDLGIILLRVGAFAIGAFIVISTIIAAVKAFILPRGVHVWLVRLVFQVVGFFFVGRASRSESYAQRDKIMALYAPTALILLPMVMLSLVLIGYIFLFMAVGASSISNAFILSGSSLLTLGNASIDTLPFKLLEFSEAMLGLILVALIIAYLPAMYNAFARRESTVVMLEVRAGVPPAAWEFITRTYQNGELNHLEDVWKTWQVWFAELEESHTSLPPLIYFRSPRPELSWVTASGVILDTASLMLSTIDVPYEPHAPFCIRSGFLALRQIAGFLGVDFDPDPQPTDPISISQDEYNAIYDQLAVVGVPLKPDREQTWLDYRGWRVNYDRVLIALATITMAPYAPWVSDRSLSPTTGESDFKPKRFL